MFTGLIESVGRVTAAQDGGAGRRLRIATTLAPELVPGDSVAVNGVCLTVTACTAESMPTSVPRPCGSRRWAVPARGLW